MKLGQSGGFKKVKPNTVGITAYPTDKEKWIYPASD